MEAIRSMEALGSADTTAPLERILPHRPPMVLVDGVVVSEGHVTEAVWTAPDDGLWIDDGCLASVALMEFAAQTAVAHAGLARLRRNLTPSHGYLAGVDGFRILAPVPAGTRLHCRVEFGLRIGALVRASCHVRRDDAEGAPVAVGDLTLASGPDDVTADDGR